MKTIWKTAALLSLGACTLFERDARSDLIPIGELPPVCTADVTLERCQSAYAGSLLQLQLLPNGPQLLHCCPAVFDAATAGQPWANNHVPRLPPKTPVPAGTFDGDVVDTIEQPNTILGSATPDFASYRSIREWLLTSRRTPIGAFSTNARFAAFEANANTLDSCEEYVYEKFYDVSKYEDAIALLRPDDWRGQYNVAFGAQATPSSIGTRRLADNAVRSRDGTKVGAFYDGSKSPKNRFLGMYPGPSYAGRSMWNLIASYLVVIDPSPDSMSSRLATISNKASARNGDTVARSFAWHRDSSAAAAALPRRVPAFDDAGNPVPRYLDEELDELDDLQTQWGKKVADLKACMARATLGVDFVSTDYGTLVIPGASQSMPQFEAAGCRAHLNELRSILLKADDQGCFEQGQTACDWSAKLFARDLRSRLTQRQESDYRTCTSKLEHTTDLNCSSTTGTCTNYAAHPGRTVADFCDTGTGLGLAQPPIASQAACLLIGSATWYSPNAIHSPPRVVRARLDAGNWLTSPTRLETYFQQLDRVTTAAAQRKLEEQRATVRVPDLVDPQTGNLKMPGEARSGGDSIGDSSWFAAQYAWSTSWGLDGWAKNVCNVHSLFSGSLHASATVAGWTVPLIDAKARLGISGSASLEVLGTSIDLSGGAAGDALGYQPPGAGEVFNLTRTFAPAKDELSTETPFMVGPIPLSLEVGIAGQAGLDLSVKAWMRGLASPDQCDAQGLGATLSGTIRPWAKVSGFAELALDAVIAEAGVRGDLTLIDASVPIGGSIDIGTQAQALAPADAKLRVGLGSNLQLSMFGGGLSAYLELGVWPVSKRLSKRIFGWDPYEKTYPLITSQYEVPIKTLFDLVASGAIR